MTILFEPSATAADSLSFALGEGVVVVDVLASLHRVLAEQPDQVLVVFGPSVETDVAADFSSAQRLARPHLGVVLVRHRLATSVLAQAMRSGVREVVKADDLPAVSDACRRSLDLSQQFLNGGSSRAAATSSLGQLVTVFSAKGGCGKTTMSTNIASVLATRGRRVCLVDFDLAFGDVAIVMQLFPARTMGDLVGMEGRLDEAVVRSLITPHASGLDTLLAPPDPGTSEGITSTVVAELLQVLKSMYDVVVVDTPPAFTDHVLAAFDQNDHFVLLATLDIPALKNLKLTLEMLDVLGYSRDRWHVVVNRADSKVGLSMTDVQKTLNVPIAAEIPSSKAVSASINRGVPIVLDEPNHPVSQAIRQFAEDIIPLRRTEPTPLLRRDRRGFPMRRRGAVAS